MEGIAQVRARIAAIQERVAALQPVRTQPTAAAVGTASFASTLQESLASAGLTTAAATTPALRLAPGEYGPLEPPPDLVRYGNGRIPAGALAPIGVGEHRLWAPAAAAFRELVTAARADGVAIGVEDSYRSYESQVRLAAEKGLYRDGGWVAEPGRSAHGWGLAVDLDLDDRARQWMRDHAWRFGFVEDVAREPWHWTYRPAG